MDAVETLQCLNGSGPEDGCEGPVEYRYPGEGEKHWPRCHAHNVARVQRAQEAADFRSPAPPRWFDPSFAGESWDED